MYKEIKTLDSRQDLTSYIEGLIQREEVKLEVETLLDVVTAEPESDKILLEEVISEIPDWAQSPFDCLLIKAAEMNFIIPTMSVSFVERVNNNITRIPLEVDAFHGVTTLRDKGLAVIDLFSLITEDKNKKDSELLHVSPHHIDHVLVMGNGSYALACDEVSKLITLNSGDVRWSRTGDNNLFYAGIVKDYLCPLINTNNIHQRVLTMPF